MLCRRIKCQNVFIGEIGAHVHIFSAFRFDIQVAKDTSQLNCAYQKVWIARKSIEFLKNFWHFIDIYSYMLWLIARIAKIWKKAQIINWRSLMCSWLPFQLEWMNRCELLLRRHSISFIVKCANLTKKNNTSHFNWKLKYWIAHSDECEDK